MSRPTQDPAERFWSKVQITGCCWLWTRAKSHGYGRFGLPGRGSGTALAHRWAYEYLVGPIPDDMVLDHICRVTSCVNPDHVRVVTQGENVLAGFAPAALWARREVCPRGHEYSPVAGKYGPARRCKVCKAEADRVRHARGKVVAAS